MERALPWTVVVLVLTMACYLKPRPMRGFMGFFFALMGLGVHGTFILTNPRAYVDFAAGALLPFYRDLAVAMVQVNPTLFGVGMLLFEVALAVLLWGPAPYARIGLLAGMGFLVGIAPLGIEVLPNVILALGLGFILRQDFPRSIPGEFASWREARRQARTTVRPG